MPNNIGGHDLDFLRSRDVIDRDHHTWYRGHHHNHVTIRFAIPICVHLEPSVFEIFCTKCTCTDSLHGRQFVPLCPALIHCSTTHVSCDLLGLDLLIGKTERVELYSCTHMPELDQINICQGHSYQGCRLGLERLGLETVSMRICIF